MNETYVLAQWEVNNDPPLHDPMDALMLVGTEAMVVFVAARSEYQRDHKHYFEAPYRTGDSTCIDCSAESWSPMWVRRYVYGDDTVKWVRDTLGRYQRRVDNTAQLLLERTLGAVSIDGEPVMLDPMLDPSMLTASEVHEQHLLEMSQSEAFLPEGSAKCLTGGECDGHGFGLHTEVCHDRMVAKGQAEPLADWERELLREQEYVPRHRSELGPKVEPVTEPPVEVVIALMNPDSPAKWDHREGIPVPRMPYLPESVDQPEV